MMHKLALIFIKMVLFMKRNITKGKNSLKLQMVEQFFLSSAYCLKMLYISIIFLKCF